MKQDRRLVGVYGSLKKDCYNHEMLGNNAEYLGTDKIWGVMYLTVGGYPRLFEHDPAKHREPEQHDLEVYLIDEDNFKEINSMERMANYAAVNVSTEWGKATVYMANPGSYSPSQMPIREYNANAL